MTAIELISLVNQVLFVGLFVVVTWRAARAPSRASFDTALLFGSVAAVLVISRLAVATDTAGSPATVGALLLLLNLAPYAMLRLVDDFSGTPRWVQIIGATAYLLVAALGFAFQVAPQLVELATIAWFLAVGGYAATAFGREIGRTRGITRRRMTAVAAGVVLFIGAIVLVFIGALVTAANPVLGILGQVAALAAVLAFFGGFAPPSWIRRIWREPDLRDFIERSIHVVSITDDRRAIVELQQAAAAAFGANGASIGLADDERGILRYPDAGSGWLEYPDNQFIAGQAYRRQHRVVADDAITADPGNADVYEGNAARAVIAAPVTADDRRIGVLAVFAERAPIFAEDDLWLLELVADQTAVLLEARMLAADASQLRGREEAARLKEEFLSAAAHDLRTPLTVVLGQAELLERRLARDPDARVDAAGISRIAGEARRLRDLISEMLDAQRLEQPGAISERITTDLRIVIDAVRGRHLEHGVSLNVAEPTGPILSPVDRKRIEQVVDNLVENALKYSAEGAPPGIELGADGTEARISVVDHGIGIPEAERGRIFDRFYRATNAQSITDTGMGLGLYICRRIVEEHDGRIWVEPTPGGGSTFVVALPLGTSSSKPRDEPAAIEPETQPSAGPVTEALADA